MHKNQIAVQKAKFISDNGYILSLMLESNILIGDIMAWRVIPDIILSGKSLEDSDNYNNLAREIETYSKNIILDNSYKSYYSYKVIVGVNKHVQLMNIGEERETKIGKLRGVMRELDITIDEPEKSLEFLDLEEIFKVLMKT